MFHNKFLFNSIFLPFKTARPALLFLQYTVDTLVWKINVMIAQNLYFHFLILHVNVLRNVQHDSFWFAPFYFLNCQCEVLLDIQVSRVRLFI